MGQEVLKALQKGWEEGGMLGSASEDIKRAWIMSPSAGRLWRRVCYLGVIWHGDGERSQNKNRGEAAEEWLYLSGNSRLGEFKKKFQTQRCKVVSKGKQEGERVKVLGFSQAGMLSQAKVHREFSSPKGGEHPCCLEN